jgi:tetratricopeptide (TPR) repeat protein
LLSFAEEAERNLPANPEKEWLQRMDDEHDNLRAAPEWSLRSARASAPTDEEDCAIGVRLACVVSYAWLYGGHLSEGRRWLALAVKQTPAPGPDRAKVLIRSGMFSWQQGDYTEAGSQIEEGTRLWRELGDREGLAEGVHMLGHLRLDQRLHSEARELLQEALDLYRALDNTPLVLTLTDDLALLAYHQGEFEAARARFEASLAVYRQQGNTDGIAATLNRLGELARLRGDHDLATSHFEESLSLFREMGNILDAPSVLKNLGHVAQARGETARARALFAEGLAVQQEQGNKQGIAECLAGLASVAQPPERAAELFGATKALLDAVGVPLSPADQADWERNVAALREWLGESGFAAAWAEGRTLAAGATAEAWDRISATALLHSAA